ncbi:MAG: ribonuclease R family protein [Gammaproteobacteria bacterium]
MSFKPSLQDFHAKALSDYGIDDIWPESVLKAAKIASDKLTEDKDYLEEFPFVTIDGEDAKDFDDAIFCTFNKDGFHLKVAIADVSFFVKELSALDLEAARRTTSVYLPKKVVPMLPERLSNELCSLQPNKRRRCLCVEINFDKDGHITNYKFHRGIIKSVARLTYTEVEEQLLNEVKDTKYKKSLEASFALFNKLTINKGYRGALDFSINEPFLKTKSDGSVHDIVSRKRLTAHKLIEEFMLAANISAADFLSYYPEQGIYRNHEHPESLKIERLSQVLKNRGINWNGDKEDINNLGTFINKVHKREDASILNMLILQSMQRAEYSTINKGHFGLKFAKYTHFTSPIRRYPDLLVHRLIIASLDQKEFNFDGLQLTLEDCSIKEKSAEFASKQVIQNLICNYVKQFSGKNFSGYVTGVKEFGLFVEIPKLFTSGLLHVNDLPNDYYRYNARHHCLDGKRRGNKFSLGDRIDVFIGDVKELEGKISLYY